MGLGFGSRVWVKGSSGWAGAGPTLAAEGVSAGAVERLERLGSCLETGLVARFMLALGRMLPKVLALQCARGTRAQRQGSAQGLSTRAPAVLAPRHSPRRVSSQNACAVRYQGSRTP